MDVSERLGKKGKFREKTERSLRRVGGKEALVVTMVWRNRKTGGKVLKLGKSQKGKGKNMHHNV